MSQSNVERKNHYSQVCVWPATVVDSASIEEFEEFFKQQGWRVQYLEQIQTEKGSNDLFFAVHEDDITTFAVPRLAMGIRWIEDVLSNVNGYHLNPLYPKRVKEYCTWNHENIE